MLFNTLIRCANTAELQLICAGLTGCLPFCLAHEVTCGIVPAVPLSRLLQGPGTSTAETRLPVQLLRHRNLSYPSRQLLLLQLNSLDGVVELATTKTGSISLQVRSEGLCLFFFLTSVPHLHNARQDIFKLCSYDELQGLVETCIGVSSELVEDKNGIHVLKRIVSAYSPRFWQWVAFQADDLARNRNASVGPLLSGPEFVLTGFRLCRCC